MAGERRYVPASEFCDSVRDGTHDSPKPVDHGRRLVTSRHLTSGRLDLSSAYLISEEDYRAINNRSRVDQWDVLLSMIGTVGEPCLIREQPDFAIKNIGLFKSRNHVDGKWLYYYLRSSEAQQWIREQARGTTQQYVPLGALRNLPILTVDDEGERFQITSILGTLDDKIELNRRMNATLEAISRAIFKSWFVDFDPVRQKAAGKQPIGMDAQTAALFPDSFEDSEVGEVPKGWRVGRLGDVAEHPRRPARPTEIPAGTAYIGLEHMPRRCIALSDWGMGESVESNKFEFRRGEILFGKLRPYFHKVGVAPMDGVCSTDIVVAKPSSPEWFGFVLGHMSSDEFVAYTNAGSTGTKMPRTNWEDMSRYAVARPSESVAKVFSDVVGKAVNSMIERIYVSRTVSSLRDTLLPKLLSGELRVPEAEGMVEEAVG